MKPKRSEVSQRLYLVWHLEVLRTASYRVSGLVSEALWEGHFAGLSSGGGGGVGTASQAPLDTTRRRAGGGARTKQGRKWAGGTGGLGPPPAGQEDGPSEGAPLQI